MTALIIRLAYQHFMTMDVDSCIEVPSNALRVTVLRNNRYNCSEYRYNFLSLYVDVCNGIPYCFLLKCNVKFVTRYIAISVIGIIIFNLYYLLPFFQICKFSNT